MFVVRGCGSYNGVSNDGPTYHFEDLSAACDHREGMVARWSVVRKVAGLEEVADSRSTFWRAGALDANAGKKMQPRD